jgi:hypothetical protein
MLAGAVYTLPCREKHEQFTISIRHCRPTAEACPARPAP